MNPRVPTVSYLGWHGKGNIGDDAIYDAVRSQLPGARFLDLPRFPHERIRAAATGLNKSLRHSTHILGGGTLVGRRHWRGLASHAAALTKKQGSFAIGVGVEDPVFKGRRSGSGNNELKRWAPVLADFNIISVRGPRSAELLGDVGIDAQVTGDPALLLPRPDVAVQDGLIGVNLGFGDDLWGHDPDYLAETTSQSVKVLASKGYRFRGILMNASDARWTERVLADVTAEIVAPADAAAASREFAACSAVIVSRLHAGILAALTGTPAISLEYQPKCRDFALSIDDERSLIRTDQVVAHDIVDRVLAALSDSAAIRKRTCTAVEKLQRRLHDDYATVRQSVGLV
ncbi:MAG: polysaccharide pyruvyl transferase family protein [Mycobacterium sp.]